MDAPNSYKDPYWATIAANAERTVGIPSGLLTAVFTHGEKTDNGRVSSAGAKSPFQIIPSTRDAYLKKYGVDAYLSPENAAEVGALHLKESLDRNKNDPSIAVAEYHAGTNRANWGPITAKYVDRVMSKYAPNTAQNTPVAQSNTAQPATNNVALKDSTYSRALAAQQGGPSGQTGDIASVYAAYKSGAMPPEDAAAFEGEVNAGRMLLPRGAALNPATSDRAGLPNENARGSSPAANPATAQTLIPPAMAQAYQSGAMNGQDRIEFEALVKNGTFKMPDGMQIGQVAPPPSIGQRVAGVGDAIAGIPGAIKEAITGAQRTTPEVQDAIDKNRTLYDMPETNTMSMGLVKSALGGFFANSKERADILAANLPGVTVRQDEQGNQWLKSPKDGQEYVIPPGFKVQDTPRAVGAIAAFTPAGRVATIPGIALKSAATQAGIEGSQAATGGTFDPGDVALAGALGAGLPAVLQGTGTLVNAGKNAAGRVLNKAATGMPEMPMAGVIPQADAAAAALPVAERAAVQGVPLPKIAPVAQDTIAETAPIAQKIQRGIINKTDERPSFDALKEKEEVQKIAEYYTSKEKYFAPNAIYKYAENESGKITSRKFISIETPDSSKRLGFIDSKGGVYTGTGAKADPLKVADPDTLKKIRQELADTFEKVRASSAKNQAKFDQPIENLANEAADMGLTIRINYPDDSTSRYIYATRADGAQQKIRIADHPQPMEGGKVVGGYSQKLGVRHAPSDLSVDPNSGATIDDALAHLQGFADEIKPAIKPVAPVIEPIATPTAAPVDVPAPPVITPTAQTAGNIEAVQAAARTAAQGGFGSKKATQSLADMVAPDAQTVAAAERLDMLNDLQPGHITTNGAYRQLDQLVKSQTGSPALQAQREGLLKVVEKANGYIEAMGGAADGDVSTLSAKVLAEGQASIKQVKTDAKAMFDEVDAAIPAATPIEAANTVGMIRARAANIGGEANLSGAEKQILGKLSGEGVQPVYGLINDIRIQLNAAKYGKAQEAFQGIDDKLRDNLINALRADQGAAAKTAGVGAEFESAQALSRAYKGTQEDMKVIFGKALDKSLGPMLKNATKNLARGNDATFIKLITATPPELRQEVVATGLQSFFNASTRGGEMNFGAYAQWFEKLKTQQKAYTALMANLPKGAPQQLADLARVSRGIAMSKGEFIATGKALNTKALEQADGFANRIFDMVKERGMAGLMAETIGTTSGAPGLATAVGSMLTKNKPTIMQSADKLISSPEFMRAVTATVQQKPVAVKAMAGSAVFSKFAKEAGNPPAMKNREQWITSAMQAAQNKKGKK